MNQHDDVICQVRESFAGLRMDTAVEQVFSRGRSRRQHRAARLTAGTAAVTAGAAVAITLTLGGPAPAPGGHGPAGPGSPLPGNPAPVKLAAFSVTSGPGASTTLTLHKGTRYRRLDPAAVRRALARHGIPALVTVGTFCRPATTAGGRPDQGKHAPAPAGAAARGSAVVIIGQKMPPGTKLSIGLFPGVIRMLPVKDGSKLTCSSQLNQPAAHLTPTGTPIRG